MPRQTFIPLATELIKKAGFSDGIFANDETDWECDWALEKITNQLSETYGTSFTAVQIHLKELDLLMNIHRYRELKSQTAVSF